MAKKYNIYLGRKKVRTRLSPSDSKRVAGALRVGQHVKKMQGLKTQKVRRKIVK